MKQKLDELIIVGVLLGAHGVRGDCRVKSFTETPANALTFGSLLGPQGEVLLTPKSARVSKDQFIVTPEEHRQKEDWDALKGTLLHIYRDELPEPETDDFYIEDLVGLAAVSPEGASLGRIKAVHNFGAGDLLEITPDKGITKSGKTVMVPFTLIDVPEVEIAAGKVVVATLDVWADESGKPEPSQ